MLLGRHGGWWEEKDRLGCPYLFASSDVGGGSVPDADADADADLARSILACPESAELAVDGHPEVGRDDDLGLRGDDGVPTFSCRAGSPLAEAGRGQSRALVTLQSGLGPVRG